MAGKLNRQRNSRSLVAKNGQSDDGSEVVRGSYNSTKGQPLIVRILPGHGTSYKSHLCGYTTQTPTCGGETSEIITNGTGPRPIAKDLVCHSTLAGCIMSNDEIERTDVTNDITAMLERNTVPVFRPIPTAICDTKAPATDACNNRFRPIRL